jgi:hypothetical protein
VWRQREGDEARDRGDHGQPEEGLAAPDRPVPLLHALAGGAAEHLRA